MRRNHQQHEASSADVEVEHDRGREIAFLIAGIGIGSGIALLLAPAAGEDVRYTIRRRYRRTMKTITRTANGLRDRAEDLIGRAHDLRERNSQLFHFPRIEGILRRRAG
jgi:hypothetical protein